MAYRPLVVGVQAEDDPGDDLGPTSPHHRLRLERTALTEERPVGNPNLDFSLHQLRQLGANSTGTRFRATLQGYVTSNDHYAVLVLHAVGGPVSLGYVSRSVINNEDKQHFDFLLPWISGSGRLLTMSWQVHGSASQLLGESQHFSIWVR